jgi:hypothetical protein
MDEGRDVEIPRGCLRRRVLLTSLTGVLTAGMVGCTSAEPSTPEADAGTPAGPAAQVIARTDEVPVGGGITVGNILLVQPTAGTFGAFSIICPHRGGTSQSARRQRDHDVLGTQLDLQGGGWFARRGPRPPRSDTGTDHR